MRNIPTRVELETWNITNLNIFSIRCAQRIEPIFTFAPNNVRIYLSKQLNNLNSDLLTPDQSSSILMEIIDICFQSEEPREWTYAAGCLSSAVYVSLLTHFSASFVTQGLDRSAAAAKGAHFAAMNCFKAFEKAHATADQLSNLIEQIWMDFENIQRISRGNSPIDIAELGPLWNPPFSQGENVSQ